MKNKMSYVSPAWWRFASADDTLIAKISFIISVMYSSTQIDKTKIIAPTVRQLSPVSVITPTTNFLIGLLTPAVTCCSFLLSVNSTVFVSETTTISFLNALLFLMTKTVL